MTANTNIYIDKSAFDELLRYTQQNAGAFKDVVAVMQERADLELNYQKALSKLAVRANKVNPTTGGDFLNAWKSLGKQIEAEAQSHKTISASITNEVIKPLRKLLDQRIKERKSDLGPIDKATKQVTDRRNDVFKAQKNLLAKTKEFETTANLSQATKNSKGKELSQKERSKASSKHGKVSEAVIKADREYLKAVRTAEQARTQRILVINQGAYAVQTAESKFMEDVKGMIIKFVDCLAGIGPLIKGHYDTMRNSFTAVSCMKDVQSVVIQKGNQAAPEEQVLYDCFEDDMNIKISHQNRQQHIMRKLEMLDSSEQEGRAAPGKNEKLPPNYQYLQLVHDKDMVNLLNASRYRVVCCLATINSKPKPNNPVAAHIRTEKEKSGGVKSFLNLPRDKQGQATMTVQKSSHNGLQVDFSTQPSVEGNAVPPAAAVAPVAAAATIPPPGDVSPSAPPAPAPPPVEPAAPAPVAPAPVAPAPVAPTAAPVDQSSPVDDEWGDETDSSEKYIAMYDFVPDGEGELALKEGDTVYVTGKDDDGWWYGTVDGKSGQFPETYVKKAD